MKFRIRHHRPVGETLSGQAFPLEAKRGKAIQRCAREDFLEVKKGLPAVLGERRSMAPLRPLTHPPLGSHPKR